VGRTEPVTGAHDEGEDTVKDRIERVVILGGGTAGWMSAAYLGKTFQGSVKISVLEAPSIPTIGVGEATVPNLQRVFFDHLGIPEDEWMRECNASFKMAVKFINWRTPGDGQSTAREWNGRPDVFHHPFGLLPAHDEVPVSHYWSYRLLHGQTDEPFDYACFAEPAVMDAKLAPRRPDNSPAVPYAWHFDAHLVADFLRRYATEKQGCEHVQGVMRRVLRDPNGYVTALETEAGELLEGDLFIDCTGFRGLLINKELGEPFVDMSDRLVNDSAVACAIPHDDEQHGVEPYTSAIAMSSGWTWRIPMLGRFGSGYVFSSRFTDHDQAAEEFCRMWGLDPGTTNLNKIRFRVGRNQRAWVKNVVGIGLSSCFLEPLESTGIYFICAALYQLAKHFPDGRFDPVLVDRYNKEIEASFDDTRDFIQAHFYLSPRTDTEFWRANKEIELGDGIKEKIALFRAGVPFNAPVTDEGTYYTSFETEFRNFWTNGSYYCIFTGLGLVPDHSLPALSYKPQALRAGDQLFEDIRKKEADLLNTLPANYDFLRRLHGAS
jgi:tryptophan 6-halogenase